MAEYGVFEDGACIEAGFHGEAGKAAAEEHAASLVAAHPEMATAYQVLEMCPDHEEQPKQDCEECAADGGDLGPGFCMACGETFESHEDLDAHQEETGHEMEQASHPLRKEAQANVATMAAQLTDGALCLAWMATEGKPGTQELAIVRGGIMDELNERLGDDLFDEWLMDVDSSGNGVNPLGFFATAR